MEVLVAMQTTSPQDRAAIDAWIEGNGTREERDRVLGYIKGGVDQGAALAWIAIVAKLLQASERIPGLNLATVQTPIQTPSEPRPKRTARPKRERGECDPPRPRRGENAKCRGDWGDSIQNCILRSGGLRRDAREAAELKHAAGEDWRVAAKLLRKNGQPWYKLAAVLTEEGYVPPDEHGRPDEAAALQRLVDAIRGGYVGPSPELNACAYQRVEREEEAEERREWEDRALAEMEEMARAGNLPPGEYEIDEGDPVPF